MTTPRRRCAWVGPDPLYRQYHDREWGVPCHDDRVLFEFLLLEGAQAGLSWITILKKRAHYRRVFDDFDPLRIAAYGPERIEHLMQDPGIVRNRLKLNAAVQNARCFLELQARHGSFSAYLWDFVDGRPLQNHWAGAGQVPTTTAESDRLSRALKQQGFKFVGSTICYAFMQAVGMVNDHTTDCFRHRQLNRAAG